MGKGPEVGEITAHSRTLKTSVPGMQGGAGVSGITVKNKAKEAGLGQISHLAISRHTPPGDLVSTLSMDKLYPERLSCMDASSPASDRVPVPLLFCHVLDGR